LEKSLGLTLGGTLMACSDLFYRRSGCRRDGDVGQALEPFDVGGLFHDAGREVDKRHVAFRIDPEARTARSKVAEAPRRRESSEVVMADGFPSQKEADAEVGRRGFPAAADRQRLEELVRSFAGLIPGRHINDRRRDDPRAVELAAAPEHLRETEHVRCGGNAPDPGHLRVLFFEGAVGAEVAMPQVVDWRLIEEDRNDVARAEVLANPYRRVLHF